MMGVTETGAGDSCCEMFSTRFNRWVFPHSYGWIEHEQDGPLGARELRVHDLNGTLHTAIVNGRWVGVPEPPLVYRPTNDSHAPLPPHPPSKWWDNYFWHFYIGWKNLPNDNYPGTFWYVTCDSWINNHYGYNYPVVPVDDLNITYPLNNVEATTALDGSDVLVALRNNMLEFVNYEMRVNDGAWQPFDLAPFSGQPGTFRWSPVQDGTELSIRGVNIAGAHSPEVVIEYALVYPPATPNGDVNDDSSVNGLDIETFLGLVFGAEASEVQLCRGDFDGDGVIGEGDLAGFAEALVQP